MKTVLQPAELVQRRFQQDCTLLAYLPTTASVTGSSYTACFDQAVPP